MTNTEKSALVQKLIISCKSLGSTDYVSAENLRNRAEMIIHKVFGTDSQRYIEKLERIAFEPAEFIGEASHGERESEWQKGVTRFQNLCNLMLEDLRLSAFGEQGKVPVTTKGGYKITIQSPSSSSSQSSTHKVFIVHGHDEVMKLEVARTLERLDLKPVILNEQSDKGMTVMEKLEAHSDVDFAVVILSPDDMGYSKKDGQQSAKSRARQNVVLELGLFIGKLGRKKVVALYKESSDFEMPSDFNGVIYKHYDTGGGWRLALAKELRAAKYDVDLNKLCTDYNNS